ncbi:MAG: hypothetical protein VB088_02090 [Sphaerochaeta sp.]|nr:hypothetical protein [Sphaerochaeta sp.]
MSELVEVIGGIAAVLLAGLWALFQRKLRKAQSRAEKAEQRAQSAELRLKIGETASKAKDDILAGQKERQEQKDAIDQKIAESVQEEDPDEKREEQQQIVDGINNLFNARNSAK